MDEPLPSIEVAPLSDGVPGIAELLARGDASLGHEPRVLGALARAYGQRAELLLARRRGHAVALLPLLRVRGPFGATDASVAYLDGGGPLGEPAAGQALVLEAVRRAAARGASLELRSAVPVALAGLQAETSRAKDLLVRDLPADPDAIARQLDAKTRNQLRKALRDGLHAETRAASPEGVRAFHGVYARTMRDLGSPSHGLSLFEELGRSLGPRVRISLVRDRASRVLAGAFVVDDRGGGAVLPWAASDRRADLHEPNTLLYWEMLSDAVRRGRRTFNFGRSSRDTPQLRFKLRWGAEPRPIHWTTFRERGARRAPGGADRRGAFLLATEAWRRLPLALARGLGPIACRWLAA